MSVYKVKAC